MSNIEIGTKKRSSGDDNLFSEIQKYKDVTKDLSPTGIASAIDRKTISRKATCSNSFVVALTLEFLDLIGKYLRTKT